MLSTKLFTIITVITKTVAQEHYSALKATTLQILREKLEPSLTSLSETPTKWWLKSFPMHGLSDTCTLAV